MSVFIEGLSADYVLDHCNRTMDSDGISNVTAHMVLNEVEVEKIRIKKIPTPHGRLIDADRLIAVMESVAGTQERLIPLSAVLGLIKNSKTIIEAEE